MSAKEKEAAAKQTFTFLAPLTNEQPCVADKHNADKRGFISVMFICYHTYYYYSSFFPDKEESLQQASCVLLP